MPQPPSQLKSRAASKAGRAPASQVAPGRVEDTIANVIVSHKAQLERVLTGAMPVVRLQQLAATTMRTTPDLAKCTPISIIGALMTLAQVGLEPGPAGHAYLIPRWNGKLGTHECQLVIGYKGYAHLARRSGTFRSIRSWLVTREDVRQGRFEITYGPRPELRHEPLLFDPHTGDPIQVSQDDVVGAYAVAAYADGNGYEFWYSDLHEIHDARDRSDAYGGRIRQKKDPTGPWVSDWQAMYRKTPVRRLAAWIDLGTPEFAAAVNADEQIHTRLDVSALDTPPRAPLEVETAVVQGELVPDRHPAVADKATAPERGEAEEIVWPDPAPIPNDTTESADQSAAGEGD